MSLNITAWNIDPNRTWFVRLADAGSSISVALYTSEADAQAQTNPQASGSTSGFGSALPVTLTVATGAIYPVSLFQSAYSWHLAVSGSDGDTTKIFRIKEFVELDEIDHPVYRNAELIPLRAAAEINAHTNVKYTRSLQLGTVFPSITEGSIGILTSARHGISERGQVVTHTISGTHASLTSSIELVTHKALKR